MMVQNWPRPKRRFWARSDFSPKSVNPRTSVAQPVPDTTSLGSSRMKRFTDAITKAVTDKNWLAAVALSLTMPDICGRMEQPKHGSEKRYKAWWDKYMLDRYSSTILNRHRVFLSGADAYALRCAYVHEGGGNTLNQRAREALTHFHFVTPNERLSIHNMRLSSQGNARLILQVDIFCQDVIGAVGRWSNDVASNQAVQERLQSLLEIHEITPALINRLGSGA
jgi:hypothetical protein